MKYMIWYYDIKPFNDGYVNYPNGSDLSLEEVQDLLNRRLTQVNCGYNIMLKESGTIENTIMVYIDSWNHRFEMR